MLRHLFYISEDEDYRFVIQFCSHHRYDIEKEFKTGLIC